MTIQAHSSRKSFATAVRNLRDSQLTNRMAGRREWGV
jgi:hypothetical protein